MSEKKILDLARYRKEKMQADKDPAPSNKDDQSFEEKLQEFIHRPFNDPGSKKDLISIFEQEHLRQEKEDEEG